MKRLFLALVLSALVVAITQAASLTFTVTPSTPLVFGTGGNNVVGVLQDSAPGFASGSLASNGIAKTDTYLTPESLFGGREVSLGEVAGMSYWTKKGTTHAVDLRDWYMVIYTKPYVGDKSTPTWYGSRIGAEPYFASSMNAPAGIWNEWSTEADENQLRFFESTQGAPGANFGTYNDPSWSTLLSGNSLSGHAYAGQKVLFFSLQTASSWAAGFTGQLDGLRIELTDGSVAKVNFEAVNVATDAGSCKKDGWQTLFRANGTGFNNQGDCVSYVNTGR
ncbi:MAG: hypothetical protein V4690_00075 [Patescibacteria group bacterium]